MAFGKPLDALTNLLLWTRSLLPSCLFHFSVETVMPVAKNSHHSVVVWYAYLTYSTGLPT